MTSTIIQTTTLYFRQGNSDKVYQASIEGTSGDGGTLLDGDGRQVPAGNVTIPPNHAIPQVGTVVEARYLHAFRESGAVYQPVYLCPRDDIPNEECTTDQLKFKAQSKAP